MVRTRIGKRAAVVAVVAVVAGIARAPGADPAGKPAAGARTVFFDDFSGPGLDRAKWNVEVTGPTYNDEQQAYIDSTDTVHVARGAEAAGAENGALVIEARHRPGFVTPQGKHFDFVSGRITTRGKVEFAHGTAAARMKLPPGSGLWPAFWILGAGNWPDTGEIDVMEYVGETDWTGVAIHGPGYSGETPLVNKAFFPATHGADEWHVYAVDWSPEALVFKVDDRTVYRATRPMVEHYGRWVFDDPKFLILNLALGGAYPFKTNRVKAPYHGIPESTVREIKEGRAKVLVDWVRVTKR